MRGQNNQELGHTKGGFTSGGNNDETKRSLQLSFMSISVNICGQVFRDLSRII